MKCKIDSYKVKLKTPFHYFLAELKFLPYSKITIQDDKFFGVGEIAHSIDVNGELQEGVKFYIPYIKNILKNKSQLESVDDIRSIMKECRLYIAHNTGLMCGIEQALFSILKQKTNKNLLQLLDIKPSEEDIFIQITIPFLPDLKSYHKHINNILKTNNPKFIKFKVGKNLELEILAIEYLKSINNIVSVSVDANQAFGDVDKAIDFANKLYKLKISWAEQLIHKDDIKGLKKLRNNTKLPLMVDEGLHSTIDAIFYAQNKYYDYFNIKLAKTGGILKALEIIEIAKQYNIPVMLGSMLHGEIGLEYNLEFTLSNIFITQDFYSYFNLLNKNKNKYINNKLLVNKNIFLKK